MRKRTAANPMAVRAEERCRRRCQTKWPNRCGRIARGADDAGDRDGPGPPSSADRADPGGVRDATTRTTKKNTTPWRQNRQRDGRDRRGLQATLVLRHLVSALLAVFLHLLEDGLALLLLADEEADEARADEEEDGPRDADADRERGVVGLLLLRAAAAAAAAHVRVRSAPRERARAVADAEAGPTRHADRVELVDAGERAVAPEGVLLVRRGGHHRGRDGAARRLARLVALGEAHAAVRDREVVVLARGRADEVVADGEGDGGRDVLDGRGDDLARHVGADVVGRVLVGVDADDPLGRGRLLRERRPVEDGALPAKGLGGVHAARRARAAAGAEDDRHIVVDEVDGGVDAAAVAAAREEPRGVLARREAAVGLVAKRVARADLDGGARGAVLGDAVDEADDEARDGEDREARDDADLLRGERLRELAGDDAGEVAALVVHEGQRLEVGQAARVDVVDEREVARRVARRGVERRRRVQKADADRKVRVLRGVLELALVGRLVAVDGGVHLEAAVGQRRARLDRAEPREVHERAIINDARRRLGALDVGHDERHLVLVRRLAPRPLDRPVARARRALERGALGAALPRRQIAAHKVVAVRNNRRLGRARRLDARRLRRRRSGQREREDGGRAHAGLSKGRRADDPDGSS
mmetsp:Transcript_23084/g.91560  ORF Transcript_23084/g.91560 Transcript_23084/m.91560 type:complete len:648 (-) Transcript_23084:44-1987(-)